MVGVGNLLRGDDGLGPTATRILRNMKLPSEVEVRETSNLFDLLDDKLKNYDKLFIVDAVSYGSKPGSLHSFSPDLGEAKRRTALSLHETGIREVLRLASVLGLLPGEVTIMGCEPLEIRIL